MNETTAIREREAGCIPPELQRSVPREVELTGAGKAGAGALVVLLLGAVLGPLWVYGIASRDAAERQKYLQEGRPTTARVEQIGRASGDPPRQPVSYRYEVAGQSYAGRVRMGKRAAARLAPGAPLVVNYLASAPGRSWLPGEEPRGIPLGLVPAAAALPLLIAGLVGWKLRKEHELLVHGRPAIARVTAVKRVRVGGPHGSHQVYRVQVEFQLLSGAVHSAGFDVQRRPPTPEALIPILYDAEQPKRLARYPLALVRTARY